MIFAMKKRQCRAIQSKQDIKKGDIMLPPFIKKDNLSRKFLAIESKVFHGKNQREHTPDHDNANQQIHHRIKVMSQTQYHPD